MNPTLKRIALAVPPVRRLYEFGRANQVRVAELQQRQETLELQLYVMRSDLQRAAVRNEALAGELASRDMQAKDAEMLKAIMERVNFSIELAQQSSAACGNLAGTYGELAGTHGKLARTYGKLAGKLTMLEPAVTSKASLSTGNASSSQAELYLDLLEKALTGVLWNDAPMDPWSKGYEPEVRAIGRDWPTTAWTMIGSARLRNFRNLIETVIAENTPGDILEAGVWRGGACVLARGVLAAHNIKDRRVWVADSFQGLPPPDGRYPADAGDAHSTFEQLQVSEDTVKGNFAKVGLLDDQVKFLRGWFEETLPQAPIDSLSVLRLDGDMYSSTIQTLNALYSKLSVGGFVIVDDYILKGCQQAVEDFRKACGIGDPLEEIDGAAVYWKKSHA